MKRSRFIIKPKKKRRKKTRRKSPALPPAPPKDYNEAKAVYNTPEYKAWRETILRRDRYTCQLCGQKGGKLEVHHIRQIGRASCRERV